MTVNESTVDPAVAAIREEITALDLRLVATINERIEAVERLRRYKQQNGIAFFDPNREAWLVQHLKDVNKGPLSEEGLEELVAFVLGLVKREVTDPRG
ncbi:MAG TPA: chorismate mutase [Gaiellaceae bacterium]|nr:chorismate mutase [Gaiellaceae bacterium]